MSRIARLASKEQMLVQPIVERELRVQARASGTFWLRVFAGSAALATLAAAFQMERELALVGRGARGPWLFALLHSAISFFFAVTCPLMSSDTVARERREGTLGILLLTPVSPGSIVFGKMMVHLIRAFTIWLAIVPVLAVPVLLGGIGVIDVIFALGIEFGVVLGSLAAGLIASSLSVQPGKAMGLAIVLTLLIGEALAWLSFLGLLPSLLAHPTSEYRRHLLLTATLGPWFLGTGLLENGFSGVLGRNPPWMRPALFTSLGAVLLGSCLAAVFAVLLAARRIRGLNRVQERTERQEARRLFWFKPRFTRWQKLRRHGVLTQSPLFWLYAGQPSAALTRWTWCGVVLATWAVIFAVGFEDNDMQPMVFGAPIVLMLGLGLAASAAFRRELEEGTLELLLVTPVPPASIVSARVLSLWRDFLPALVMASGLAVVWVVSNEFRPGGLVWLLILTWSSFLALPAIGSRLAVRRLSPLVGWLWTLGIAAALPYVFGLLAAVATGRDGGGGWPFIFRFTLSFVPFQLAMAGFSAWCTVADLATRRFRLKPLQRPTR